ncbi:BTAD domain-containing putative transcriptional regulator [Oerskovia sp. M15]
MIGPFQVRVDGQVRPMPHSAERVLAVVALVGPLARSRAAALLWPDANPSRAGANLRAALSRLGDVAEGSSTFRVRCSRSRRRHCSTSTPPSHGSTRPSTTTCFRRPVHRPHGSAGLCSRVGTAGSPAPTSGCRCSRRRRSGAPRSGSSPQGTPTAPCRTPSRRSRCSRGRRAPTGSRSRSTPAGDPSNALRHYRRFRRALGLELGVEPGPDIRAAIRQLYPFGNPLVDPVDPQAARS